MDVFRDAVSPSQVFVDFAIGDTDVVLLGKGFLDATDVSEAHLFATPEVSFGI